METPPPYLLLPYSRVVEHAKRVLFFEHQYEDRPLTRYSPDGAARWKYDEFDEPETPGQLVVYVFGYTQQRVIDLVEFVVVASSSEEASYERVAAMIEAMRPDIPERGLRSRELRAAAAHKGLLEAARMRLFHIVRESPVFRDDHRPAPVREGRERMDLNDAFLAAFVLDYDATLRSGGTRAEIAERQGKSPKTIENWIDRARVRGLWATSSRGTPGQPTSLAYQLAEGES